MKNSELKVVLPDLRHIRHSVSSALLSVQSAQKRMPSDPKFADELLHDGIKKLKRILDELDGHCERENI